MAPQHLNKFEHTALEWQDYRQLQVWDQINHMFRETLDCVQNFSFTWHRANLSKILTLGQLSVQCSTTSTTFQIIVTQPQCFGHLIILRIHVLIYFSCQKQICFYIIKSAAVYAPSSSYFSKNTIFDVAKPIDFHSSFERQTRWKNEEMKRQMQRNMGGCDISVKQPQNFKSMHLGLLTH